ncbi:hypothetical protein [Pseudomonas turukhanskensis]|uniref:Uncharacterized protein n=1 Tax=Pseudomonas turukhanskensis TaxID=1806536 RepID=A0A9W6K5A9_9PSED|nr:hypothetical protein [Pseudomonas turukhanskensis]GLK88518.1 hypothetical protein GCM10017655_15800 [Pseudomonas turukhanskensis]
MNPLVTNEVLGVLALQATLACMPDRTIELSNSMLILPLIFNKRTRSILKNKNVMYISSRDLVLSFPKDFSAVSNHFLDFSCISVNTVLLACEMGVAKFDERTLSLVSEVFTSTNQKSIGQLGAEIYLAAPRLAKILEENSTELYQNFRIVL